MNAVAEEISSWMCDYKHNKCNAVCVRVCVCGGMRFQMEFRFHTVASTAGEQVQDLWSPKWGSSRTKTNYLTRLWITGKASSTRAHIIPSDNKETES